MLPRPKSEAWLLCALKEVPYQNCEKLEEESGNDGAVNSLKDRLASRLGQDATRKLLNEILSEGRIDAARIDMPSFNEFRDDLERVIRDID
ncbi:hypothetical protein D3C86_1883510 [compost metagenome]